MSDTNSSGAQITWLIIRPFFVATAPSRLLGVFGAVPRYDSGDMGADAEIPSMNWAQMQPELAPVETLEYGRFWRNEVFGDWILPKLYCCPTARS